VRCIYNGIDLSRYPNHRRRSSDSSPPVILSVGRLIEKKGFIDLVEAAEILRRCGRSFRVEIIGEGPLRKQIHATVKQFGLEERVKLLGPLPLELVRFAYMRCAIFALPCVIGAGGDRDGIPTVLQEAMASGIPVVSTPVSGIPELIESERDGLLVPPNDPVMLAEALDRLLSDPDLGNRLGVAATAKMKDRFSIDRSCSQLMALFEAGEPLYHE
jgi:glycosyltransferase involved in cell wall biosynthesis